jgi:hypothetical protein
LDPILIGLAALMWSAHKKNKARHSVNGSDRSDGVTAILYQLPSDSFTTTRMAIWSGGDDPREMGIFQTPDEAKAVAMRNGWNLAYGGEVLSRKTRPGADS